METPGWGSLVKYNTIWNVHHESCQTFKQCWFTSPFQTNVVPPCDALHSRGYHTRSPGRRQQTDACLLHLHTHHVLHTSCCSRDDDWMGLLMERHVGGDCRIQTWSQTGCCWHCGVTWMAAQAWRISIIEGFHHARLTSWHEGSGFLYDCKCNWNWGSLLVSQKWLEFVVIVTGRWT